MTIIWKYYNELNESDNETMKIGTHNYVQPVRLFRLKIMEYEILKIYADLWSCVLKLTNDMESKTMRMKC